MGCSAGVPPAVAGASRSKRAWTGRLAQTAHGGPFERAGCPRCGRDARATSNGRFSLLCYAPAL